MTSDIEDAGNISVVEELDLDNVRLVGHSGGAAVAVRYLAERGSNRVHSLTLVSPMLPLTRSSWLKKWNVSGP